MKLKNYFLLFIFLCFSIFAHSGVILVTNGSDNTSGSLRQAIIAATPGDSIVIDYKGAFALITPIEINNLDSVTIIGPYAKHMYFFGDPTSFDAYFNIKNSTRIEFQNMGFWNSFGGFNAITRAVDVDSSSTVLFTSCLFEGCQPSTGSGGAIRVRNGSRIRVNYCSFINNSSEENGGAIWMDSTLVTADIQSSTFYRNTADNGKGGALYASFVQNLNSVEIINNTFHSNLASSALGDSSTASAIYTNDASTGFLTTYVTIRNNILYQNGYAGQSQVFYTNPSFSASFYTTVTHNYYYAFSASDPIPPRFTNNSFGVDYSGFPPTVTTLGLRNNVVTDGYGLKYFTITEGNSPLIDVASSSNVSTNKDCRRAPRFMDGDLNSTEINDIGAAEYTPYRVTDPLFSYTWEDLVNTEINVSPNPGEIHYVEFDLSDPITGVRLNNFVPQFNRTVYIDGYSQDGSAIPGSNNTSTNTDTVAPARNLVTFYSQGAGADNAVQFNNAPNSIIAGLSMIDFNLNAVVIEPAATGTTVFGNVIGVESNAANNLSVSPGNGAGRAGVLVKANDVTIGGDFHHQRNVIVDNGYDETTAFTDYFGANIHVVAPVDNLSIKGNIIGLHPNGKDTIPIQFTNIKRPNGIYIESGSNINIGGQYLFGKNIISNHPGNGIFQYNGTSGNITIDNNYIGTSFDGTDPLGNQNGILLKTSSAGSNIGGYLGNIISANDSSGIRIIDGQSIRILGNTIGGDQTLTANNFGNDKGIYVTGSSGANATPILIGLDDYLSDNERNVILNNNVGIYLSGTNVQEVPIRGNLIGLPAYNATNALPNVVGIKIDSGAHHNYIGYDGSSGNFNQINLISGNSDAGVWVEGDLVNNNRVASNIIGGSIPVSGALNSLGNLTGVRFSNIQSGTSNIIGNENDSDLKLIVVGNTVGVHVTGSSDVPVFNSNIGIDTNSNMVPNKIGISVFQSDFIYIGGILEKSNRISGNDTIGIFIEDSKDIIVDGNFIGTDKTGALARPNPIGIRLHLGFDYEIGQNTGNVISGNGIGLALDSTFNNVVRNNYFGLSADGTSQIAGSNYGIVGKHLTASNDFGSSLLSNVGRNYFATDSVGIALENSSYQKIVNNIFGYQTDGTSLLGTPETGVGVYLKDAKFTRIGAPTPPVYGGNTIANQRAGIVLLNADSTQIQHSNFGTQEMGTAVSAADNQRFGILSRGLGGSSNNILGPNNVFGGNRVGIILSNLDRENQIFKNYFGIDTLLANTSGNFRNDTAIFLYNANRNFIGMSGDSSNQMINYGHGIVLRNSADSNKIVNNHIGMTSNGVTNNSSGSGIVIDNSFRNRIGTSDLGDKNTISHHGENGISIINSSSGNSFFRNEIFTNNELGIDIGGNFANDATGIVGIQDQMNTPVINSGFPCSVGGDALIEVIINDVTVGQSYYIDLYESNGYVNTTSNFGEAKNSIYFGMFSASQTGTDTIILDPVALGFTVNINDTLVAILTDATTGSSSEIGKWNEVRPAPSVLDFTDTNEVCLGGLRGGSIDLDNSLNNAYSYNVLFNGLPMSPLGGHLYREDTLPSGTHEVIVQYSNGCADTSTRSLVTGGTFDVSTTVADDTCNLNIGEMSLSVVNNSIVGAIIYNDTLYSKDSILFVQNNVFTALTAADIFSPAILLNVTRDGVTDICPATDTPPITIPNHLLTTELVFGYDNFCSDADGVVTTAPTFSNGLYSFAVNPVTSLATMNSSTGAITNADDNDLYSITYNYGSCFYTLTPSVEAYDVPDPSFTMADFCANGSSSVPNPVFLSGTYDLFSQPAGTETINVVSGILSTASTEYTAGNYHIEYNTSDANCPRTDTVVVEVFAKPAVSTLLSFGNVLDANPVDVDSITYCPTSPVVNNIFASLGNTTWTDHTGVPFSSNFYPVNLGLTDSAFYLVYYSTFENPGPVFCNTDIDSVLIQVYETPVKPNILNGDLAYCEDSPVAILENNATTSSVSWYLNGSGLGNQVVASNDFYALNGPYNNSLNTIYAQDSTGLGCVSDFDTTELTFLKRPENIELTYLGSPLVNGDSIDICPTYNDTIFANNVFVNTNTIWDTIGGIINSDIFIPNEAFNAGTNNTVYVHKDSTYTTNLPSVISSVTCQSFKDTIQIDIFQTPIAPIILSDSLTYCFGEVTDTISASNYLSTYNVLWYDSTKLDMSNLSNPSDSHFVAPTYNDQSFYVFARDSTGENCYSDYDSIVLTFHQNPNLPVLTLNTINDTVLPSEVVNLCPVSFDSLLSNTSAERTIWQINALAADTSNYFGTPYPAGLSTLRYYADTLYTSTGTYCQSSTDSVYLNVLPTPIASSFVSTSYCDNESINDFVTTSGTNLIWSVNGVPVDTTTSSPHAYTPSGVFDNHVDVITVYDSTGITKLGVGCLSSVNALLITYYARPDTATVSLFSTSTMLNDTAFICPGIADSLVADSPFSESYWYTENGSSIFTDSVFDISSFAPGSDSVIYNYTSVSYTLPIVKTCYSDTNSRVVHTFATPIMPMLSTGDTAYCEGEMIDSLAVTNAVTSVVWNEIGTTDSTTTSPHQYLQSVPASFDNSIDVITFRNVTGIINDGTECTSVTGTVQIAYHAKPQTLPVSLLSTGTNVAPLDTTFICPLPVPTESYVSDTELMSSYYWSLAQNGTYTSSTAYAIDAFTPNTTVTVYNFRDSMATFTVPKTCNSDTIARYVHTFKAPQQPNILSDSSYCEGEIIDTLTLQNDAAVTSIKWGDLSTMITDSSGLSPFEYGLTNITYDGVTKTVYAIDYTGDGCFSDTAFAFFSFHENPDDPLLTLNGIGPNLVSGDEIIICPTDPVSFLQSNDAQTNYYGSNTVMSPNDYDLTVQMPLTTDIVKSIAFENYTGVQNITCFSDTTTVIVTTYAAPVQPSITSNGIPVDTVLYCDNDIVFDLSLANTADSVNWNQIGGAAYVDSITYYVIPPSPFNGELFTYIAYDSTGIGCVSENDSIFLNFQPRPEPPILTTADNEYCEGDNIVPIFSNDVTNTTVLSDWYVNDTTIVPALMDASQYLPSYNYANGDATITYYAQTLSDEGCYSYFSQVGVSYHPTPSLPAINYTGVGLEYCPEDFLDTLSSDSVLTWFYASDINTTIVNDTFNMNDIPQTPNTIDVIQYFYTDHFNCFSAFGNVPVQVFNIPIEPVLTTDDYTYCDGDSPIIEIDALEIDLDPLVGSGSWYDSDGNLLSSGGTNSFDYDWMPVLSTGDSSLIFNYLDVNGCLSINDTITITTFPIPATPVITTADSVYCEGEMILPLNEGNGVNTNWYFIVNGIPSIVLADNSTYTPIDSGTYTAIIIENECESMTDSIEIVINQLPSTPTIAPMKIEFCSDELIDTLFIESGLNGYWFDTTDYANPIAAGSDFYSSINTINDSMQYYVSVYDDATECYSSFDSVTLYQFISLGSISTELAEICAGYAIELEATGGVSYLWSTSDSSATISVAPTESTWYFVDIVDENNCKLRDSIEVFLKLPASCEETIYTAFSPNGDGVNEFWEITGIGIYENPVVYIFNRWGDQIAKIENYDNALNVWDGINQNTNSPVVYGTYYYIIEDGGTKVKDGWLQVVK